MNDQDLARLYIDALGWAILIPVALLRPGAYLHRVIGVFVVLVAHLMDLGRALKEDHDLVI